MYTVKTKKRASSRNLLHSLSEEADALDWYEQRLALADDPQALETLEEAQGEEFRHFSANLASLLRQKPRWRGALLQTLYARYADDGEGDPEPEAEES